MGPSNVNSGEIFLSTPIKLNDEDSTSCINYVNLNKVNVEVS